MTRQQLHEVREKVSKINTTRKLYKTNKTIHKQKQTVGNVNEQVDMMALEDNLSVGQSTSTVNMKEKNGHDKGKEKLATNWTRAVSGSNLISDEDDGIVLIRKIGKEDGEKRISMVNSIMKPRDQNDNKDRNNELKRIDKKLTFKEEEEQEDTKVSNDELIQQLEEKKQVINQQQWIKIKRRNKIEKDLEDEQLMKKVIADNKEKKTEVMEPDNVGIQQWGNERCTRNIMKGIKQGYRHENVGVAFVSGKTRHNLLSGTGIQRKGLGTHLYCDQPGGYLFNDKGDRYMMRVQGKQILIDGRLYNRNGQYRDITLVHDTGASATILKDCDAGLWEERGDGLITMGGYTGETDELVGGEDLYLMFKTSTESANAVINEQFSIDQVMEEILEEENGKDIDGNSEWNRNDEDLKQFDEQEGWKENLVFHMDDVNSIGQLEEHIELEGLTESQKREVLNKVKSASEVVKCLKKDKGEKERMILEGSDKELKMKLSNEMGIMKRMKRMEHYAEIYPHLSQAALNKMVEDNIITDGIELQVSAKEKEETDYIAKGKKTKVHKKRSKTTGEDTGLGHRPPFFMVMCDLIDLTNETEGNRFGYNWLLVMVCKEYGTVKIYPLRGKDDVRPRWKQFDQWITIITPYVVAKLNVKPKVCIVGNDRGSEFMTTAGRSRGELDEELHEAGIFRFSPSAGDSNKLGKVERMNGIIVSNVNAMLRRGGAKNVWAYDAATFFEQLYNSTPTAANKVGDGEAPYTTLGIPVSRDKFCRFFCPAFVMMPKHTNVDTGEKVNQTKLTEHTKRCFVIGLGSSLLGGGDSDGYKVVLTDGTVYCSNNVVLTPHLEVVRDIITGMKKDPLIVGNELIETFMDLDEDEILEPIIEESNLDEEVESEPEELIKRRRKSKTVITNLMKKHNRMTVGTGTTGQMRHEMNNNKGNEMNRNDVMTEREARVVVNKVLRLNYIIKYIQPEQAGKTGKCRKRYEKYWKCKNGDEFKMMIKRKDSGTRNDLIFDTKKGFVSFEPNTDNESTDKGYDEVLGEALNAELMKIIKSEERLLNGVNDEVIKGKQQAGGDVEHIRFVFGLESRNCRNKNSKKVLESINLCYDNEYDDEYLREAYQFAKQELELEEVPLWLALAVFHKVEIVVDGREKPYSIKHAMRLPEWEEWKAAIMKEINGLLAIGVWKEIPREEVRDGAKVLPGKMILEIKLVDGKFEKCKARYVSRGDLSKPGEHYFESSSHQARAKSMRIFFAIAVTEYARTGKKCFVPRNLDVTQAYLQSRRKSTEPAVYMELPDQTFGLCKDRHSGFVALMQRHIYGEVDGGRAFERHLIKFLDEIGAEATVCDRMVFKWKWNGQSLTALAHVDDILYNGDGDEILEEFYRKAEVYFGKLTGGKQAEFILGIKIEWNFNDKTVKLSQRAHAEKFLKEFDYDATKTKCKETPMPLDSDMKPNEGDRVPTSEWDYYKWVGYANWLATMTRVDLGHVTNMCGRFSHNPSDDHVNIQKHVLRYIAGTLDEGLTFHGDSEVLKVPYDHTNKLVGYVDSAHGAGHDTMCIVIMLNGAAVISRVLKQRVVTTSTAHSEMIALAAGAKELVWATDFMAEIGYEQGTVRMMADNQSANLQATGDYKSSKSDHYRRVQFYVEDNVDQGLMWIDQVPTNDNVADIGTKQVTPIKQFKRLKDIVLGNKPEMILTQKVRDIISGKYNLKSHN